LLLMLAFLSYTLGRVLAAVVAAEHVGFFYLEAFLWCEKPGLKIFRQTAEKAQLSAVLAANQGFYNLLLAASIFFALAFNNETFLLFLLASVASAGVFGGLTVVKRIFYVQAGPATLAFLLTWAGSDTNKGVSAVLLVGVVLVALAAGLGYVIAGREKARTKTARDKENEE